MKGWKTLVFAVLFGAITALSSPELQQYIAENMTWLGPIIATVVAVLRALTTSPIFNKE